jgi:hypothetical protein
MPPANSGRCYGMNEPIPAIFESGVFRPLERVDLPAGTHADVIPRDSSKPLNGDWPTDYFARTAGAFSGDHFERPAQGEVPSRDSWQ